MCLGGHTTETGSVSSTVPTAAAEHKPACRLHQPRSSSPPTASRSAEGASATRVGPARHGLRTPAALEPSSSSLPAVLREEKGPQGALAAYSHGMGMHLSFYKLIKKRSLCLSVPVRLLLEVRLLLCSCSQLSFFFSKCMQRKLEESCHLLLTFRLVNAHRMTS